MLAKYKYKTSALFWYTQRYHDPRTEEHGSPAGVTVAVRYGWAAGLRTEALGSRAPRLGPRTFSIRVVDSFGGNFVRMPSLFTHQFQAKPCRCSR